MGNKLDSSPQSKTDENQVKIKQVINRREFKRTNTDTPSLESSKVSVKIFINSISVMRIPSEWKDHIESKDSLVVIWFDE